MDIAKTAMVCLTAIAIMFSIVECNRSIYAHYSLESKRLYRTMRCVHHGSDKFRRAKFRPIKDDAPIWVKPTGGLWASPVDTDWGWMHWCKAEQFRVKDLTKSFVFDLKGNILRIDSVKEAAKKLAWRKCDFPGLSIFRPVFEPLVEAGIDAIHLTQKGERETRFHRNYSLYGWDCDSVLVLNPDAIVPIEKLKE